jgi:hypothetical protein
MSATLTKTRPANVKTRPANIMPAVNDSRPSHPSFDFEDDELNPAIEELQPLCIQQRSDTLQWYRTLGKLVAKHFVRVQKEREKHNDTMYGQHFFNRLADAIKVVSAAMLRMCFNLYYYYPEPAFRELSNYKAISPTHALKLASINDGPLRQKLQEKVIEKNLSVKDLEHEIKANQPKPRKRGAGRPFKVPSSLTKALTHLNAQSDAYVRAHKQIWFGEEFNIADQVPELPSSLLSDKLRDQLGDALKACESLVSVAEAEAQELRGVIDLVDKRRAAQAECDRKAEEELSGVAAG